MTRTSSPRGMMESNLGAVDRAGVVYVVNAIDSLFGMLDHDPGIQANSQ